MRVLKKVLGGVVLLGFVTGCPGVFPPPEGDTGRTRITQEEVDSGAIPLRELMFIGRNLSIRNWKVEDGFGRGSASSAPIIDRMPGPDSTSCMSCHGLGNGVVLGWGNNAANVLVALDDPQDPTISGSNERNTPTEHGLSLIELLGKEISEDLQAVRADALADAMESGVDVTAPLTSKGVDYGVITARADGTIDASGVIGIDADLRVRPFHAKGHEATIRIFTRNALNRHHGIQATEFLLFKEPAKDPETWDEDGDGVTNELTEGELTAMTLFQVCLPIPQEVDQEKTSIARGRALMTEIGCTECHRPSLNLEDPTWRYTSSNGVTLAINLTDSNVLGAGRPHAEPDGTVEVAMWADLKRHDLGPEAHEPLDQPVEPSVPDYEPNSFAARIGEELPPIPRELMLTTELWGVRDTGPWWHDGSSPTIDDAILRHGGEAQASRDAYRALSMEDRNDLLSFLDSLQVAPVGEVLLTSDAGANAKSAPIHTGD